MKSGRYENRARSRARYPRNMDCVLPPWSRGEFSKHRPRDTGREKCNGWLPRSRTTTSFDVKRIHSLVRMRLVLASDDRNGFIADAQTKKVDNSLKDRCPFFERCELRSKMDQGRSSMIKGG